MNLKDLIEKRAKVWETAKNFVDTHENENGVLSAEDTATYNRMEQEIEDLTNAIDRQQRAEKREAELSKPVNSPLTGKPYVGEKGGKRPAEHPMRTRAQCLVRCVPTSVTCPMYCRKVWIPMVVILFRRNMTTDLLMCLRKRTS